MKYFWCFLCLFVSPLYPKVTSSLESDRLQCRSFSISRNLIFLPQSGVVIGWMKHVEFLPFPESLDSFEQSKYALHPHSMFSACLTSRSLSSLKSVFGPSVVGKLLWPIPPPSPGVILSNKMFRKCKCYNKQFLFTLDQLRHKFLFLLRRHFRYDQTTSSVN